MVFKNAGRHPAGFCSVPVNARFQNTSELVLFLLMRLSLTLHGHMQCRNKWHMRILTTIRHSRHGRSCMGFSKRYLKIKLGFCGVNGPRELGKEEIGCWRRWGEMSGSLSIALLRINSNWRQVLYKLLPTDRLMYAWGEGEGVTAHSSLVDRHSLSKERGQFSFRMAVLLVLIYLN